MAIPDVERQIAFILAHTDFDSAREVLRVTGVRWTEAPPLRELKHLPKEERLKAIREIVGGHKYLPSASHIKETAEEMLRSVSKGDTTMSRSGGIVAERQDGYLRLFIGLGIDCSDDAGFEMVEDWF